MTSGVYAGLPSLDLLASLRYLGALEITSHRFIGFHVIALVRPNEARPDANSDSQPLQMSNGPDKEVVSTGLREFVGPLRTIVLVSRASITLLHLSHSCTLTCSFARRQV